MNFLGITKRKHDNNSKHDEKKTFNRYKKLIEK